MASAVENDQRPCAILRTFVAQDPLSHSDGIMETKIRGQARWRLSGQELF